jgi:L-2-hydroxyglutarate oxidase LhgO
MLIRPIKAKILLVAIGKTGRWLSRETGIDESAISRILNGRYVNEVFPEKR